MWGLILIQSVHLGVNDVVLCVAGMLGGLVGSLVDSVLGATLQYSGFNITTQKITGTPGPKVGFTSYYSLELHKLAYWPSSALSQPAPMSCRTFFCGQLLRRWSNIHCC